MRPSVVTYRCFFCPKWRHEGNRYSTPLLDKDLLFKETIDSWSIYFNSFCSTQRSVFSIDVLGDDKSSNTKVESASLQNYVKATLTADHAKVDGSPGKQLPQQL